MVMRKSHLLIPAFLFLLSFALHAQETGMSEMRDYILQYQADNGALNRKYTIKESEEYVNRFNQLYTDWLNKLKELPFESMSQQGKVDYILLRTSIEEDASNLLRDK